MGPPEWLFRLRNFDVPMMVLIAGMSFMYAGFKGTYMSYMWKRIKRLLFPVWIFLSTYFLVIWFFGLELESLTLDKIVESYVLLKGIGYVWIIRIFLLAALAAPFILRLSNIVRSNNTYLLSLAVLYLAYECFLYFTQDYSATGFGRSMSQYVYYGIGYSLIFALGVRFQQFNTSQFIIIFMLSCLVHILCGYNYYLEAGEIVSTQKYKYPPSAYYLSYATMVAVVLWNISGSLVRRLERFCVIDSCVMFIAQNSIWIYLWHIPFVSLFVENWRNDEHFLLNYTLIYGLAVSITAIQVYVVRHLVLPKIENAGMKKTLPMVLTG